MLDYMYRQQFNLTTKQHNQIFPNYKKDWYYNFEYYIDGNDIIMCRFISKIGILCDTLLLPIRIVIKKLFHYQIIINEIKKLYNQRTYKNFHKYYFTHNSPEYIQIKQLIHK